MKTVRTTFLPRQKNRSVYFDAEETECYFEKTCGHKQVPTKRKEYHKNLGAIINAAYNDGFQDGIAESAERVAEDVEDGKAD